MKKTISGDVNVRMNNGNSTLQFLVTTLQVFVVFMCI